MCQINALNSLTACLLCISRNNYLFNPQPRLPQSHDSFAQAEKWHLYFKPQMEICATVRTENATFERIAHTCAQLSDSLSVTLTWQQALSAHVNQFKLPLQPIVVKDLISKKKTFDPDSLTKPQQLFHTPLHLVHTYAAAFWQNDCSQKCMHSSLKSFYRPRLSKRGYIIIKTFTIYQW